MDRPRHVQRVPVTDSCSAAKYGRERGSASPPDLCCLGDYGLTPCAIVARTYDCDDVPAYTGLANCMSGQGGVCGGANSSAFSPVWWWWHGREASRRKVWRGGRWSPSLYQGRKNLAKSTSTYFSRSCESRGGSMVKPSTLNIGMPMVMRAVTRRLQKSWCASILM